MGSFAYTENHVRQLACLAAFLDEGRQDHVADYVGSVIEEGAEQPELDALKLNFPLNTSYSARCRQAFEIAAEKVGIIEGGLSPKFLALRDSIIEHLRASHPRAQERAHIFGLYVVSEMGWAEADEARLKDPAARLALIDLAEQARRDSDPGPRSNTTGLRRLEH